MPPEGGPARSTAAHPGAPPRSLRSILSPTEVVDRLAARARRGKLPGFRRLDESANGTLAGFRVLAFGHPYDYELIGAVAPEAGTADGGGSRVDFRMRLLPKVPVIAAVVLILTIWPGLWITDSMLRIYFESYRIETWWWYVPLVVVSLPFLWMQFLSSRRQAHEHAAQTARAIEREIGGNGLSPSAM